MCRLLVISDLHYEFMVFRGVDESVAFRWLLGVVERVKPDVVLSVGDWGRALSHHDMSLLLSRARVLSVYGNHDNMSVLVSAGVLMEPGRVYEVCGLRVAGISGIVALRKRLRGDVPRREPGEFLAEARRLVREKPIDILVLHQPLYLPDLFPGMSEEPAVGLRSRLSRLSRLGLPWLGTCTWVTGGLSTAQRQLFTSIAAS